MSEKLPDFFVLNTTYADMTTPEAKVKAAEALAKVPSSKEKGDVAAVIDAIPPKTEDGKLEQLAAIEVLQLAISLDVNHDPSRHDGADPADADMTYCPQCNALVLLGRMKDDLMEGDSK